MHTPRVIDLALSAFDAPPRYASSQTNLGARAQTSLDKEKRNTSKNKQAIVYLNGYFLGR